MLLDARVDIPKDKGAIVLQKKCLCTYVLYTVSREYDSKNKRSNPKRVTIGKVCQDDPSKMIPNHRFSEFYPHIDLGINKESDNEELLPAPYRADSISIGPYAVINSICNDNNLKDCLEESFGKESAALTLDIASYLIVTEGNQALHYPTYAWDHALFTKNMHIYSDSAVSRHLKSITEDEMRSFFCSWNKNVSKDDYINISYDSTNKNCQAGDLELVGFGKPKTDAGTGIINVAVAYNETNEIPMFYEAYPGSIPDVCQLKYAIDLAVDYGYKYLRFILDRGYFSKENIEYIDSNGYHFVMMVKGFNTLVAPDIEPLIGTFECSLSNQIVGDVFGTTTEREFCGQKRYFHIYHNTLESGYQRRDFLNSLDSDKITLNKLIGVKFTPTAHHKQFFNLTFTEDGVLTGVSFNESAIRAKLKLCGYFSIITSEKMKAEEAYYLYKSRDVSEKLFCSSKTFIGSHCFRVHSDSALHGKLFIEFVALILRNRIFSLLKRELIRRGKSCKYLNVPAAVRELDKIKISRSPRSKYRLHYQLTKKQKQILAPFGISMNSIEEVAAKLSDLLAKQEAKPEQNDDYELEQKSVSDDYSERDAEDFYA